MEGLCKGVVSHPQPLLANSFLCDLERRGYSMVATESYSELHDDLLALEVTELAILWPAAALSFDPCTPIS
jgi:hypothetical protein